MTISDSRPERGSAASVVRARNLLKRFGTKTVIDDLDLDMPRGGCYGLLGPNGAGKTTLLRMLLGHVLPDAGTLEVLGEPVPAAARSVRARIGIVPQDDNLDPDFTVMENLRIYAGYFPQPARRPLTPWLESLLEFVSLHERATDRIQSLSGGMRRRLVIARALVNDPELLILDEPTTGLDPQVRHLIWAKLRELIKKGSTILLTTHYMEEAERLCDRLAIVDQGRILAEDTPKTLIAQRVEPSVIELRIRGAGHRASADDVPAEPTGLPEAISRHARIERIDETWHCHTHHPQRVLEHLPRYPEIEYLHRPANLEDVFLNLTGRELRD
ncbi:ATP-binding cassette domain-containing protein [Thioalkalivibrio sp. HK1]|uniref:ATP-binding cassette domain-containing protein n=1 Tax=Thioalkalivibrio sp. HK1 TaxID=1469245 RepID=UPI00046F592F|nr:ATP-binding cassette domain-containing protein [Thioalkalivibrio sp. HK1]